MKTIQEIIAKLNYLNGNSKNMSSSQWLYEIEKYEDLFCNHPDADDTCTYKGNFVMKSDVSVEDYLNQ
tara:strand:+ start:529 stop:732 length:204 start_codon:yes stop_codon:yes gene_type:complete